MTRLIDDNIDVSFAVEEKIHPPYAHPAYRGGDGGYGNGSRRGETCQITVS